MPIERSRVDLPLMLEPLMRKAGSGFVGPMCTSADVVGDGAGEERVAEGVGLEERGVGGPGGARARNV